jgi:hypothetical protein
MSNAIFESVFDTPSDEAEEARLDAVADAEIDGGLGVPHTKVREWLLELVEGKRTQPPTA